MNFKIMTTLHLSLVLFTVSCATTPERYNTQRGAAIGAGVGALLGQASGYGFEIADVRTLNLARIVVELQQVAEVHVVVTFDQRTDVEFGTIEDRVF